MFEYLPHTRTCRPAVMWPLNRTADLAAGQ